MGVESKYIDHIFHIDILIYVDTIEIDNIGIDNIGIDNIDIY
jgi:hypothetical protein